MCDQRAETSACCAGPVLTHCLLVLSCWTCLSVVSCVRRGFRAVFCVRCPARWARGWTVWQGSTVKNKCCRRAAQLPIVRSVCSACSFMYHEVRVFSVWLRCMSAVLTKTKASRHVPVLQSFSAVGFFWVFFPPSWFIWVCLCASMSFLHQTKAVSKVIGRAAPLRWGKQEEVKGLIY